MDLTPSEVLFVMATEQEFGPKLREVITPIIVGVGPIEAAIGTALALQQRVEAGSTPAMVVSLGSAGSNRHPVGSVWQITSVGWRDMDATRLGFEKGVTPFADHPARIEMLAPLSDAPSASLSTSATMIGSGKRDEVDADLSDMETFAVVRAAERFGIRVAGFRGVSDGPDTPMDVDGWQSSLEAIDARLATLVVALVGSGTAARPSG